MALHITMDVKDRVVLSCGVVIELRRAGRQTQISIEAPEDIKIDTIFHDPKKQVEMMMRDKK